MLFGQRTRQWTSSAGDGGPDAFGTQKQRVYNAPHTTGRRGAPPAQLCRAVVRRGGGEAGERRTAMYAVPDVEEVVAIAKQLGIHLGSEEVVLYQKYLMEQLREFDTFVQARLEEPRPPMISSNRQPGYPPRSDEDPLNAWMWKCRIEGAAGGLLAGKTVSFKDHIAVAGMPMRFGAFALEGFIPDFDATVVTRVLQAGGTIIGKNVMNGLSGGFGTGGGIGDYGRPLNPHNHAHVTGGSSSGSGAAVAAGEVDISFGGDQGGSIRIPAAFCGIVGHKPTFGLVSHFGLGFGSDQ